MIYFIGLCIVAVCVGNLVNAPYGFLVIGVGFVFDAIFERVLSHLNGDK